MNGRTLGDFYSTDNNHEPSDNEYESLNHRGRPVSTNFTLQQPRRRDPSQNATRHQQMTDKNIYVKAYKNLKIQLAILLTANLVVLAIFVWTCLYMNADKEKPAHVSSYVNSNLKDNFRLCTKCETLRKNYEGIDEVIRETRMEEDREICCFKRIEQMLDLFEQYATSYVDKNFKIGPCSVDMSTDKQLERLSFTKPLMHVWYSKPNQPKDGLSPLTWFSEEQERYRRYFEFNGSHVTIPVDGDYYIYSSVHFNSSAYSSNHHFLQYQEDTKPIKLVFGDRDALTSVFTSTLHGTFRLKKKSTVAVFGQESIIITKDKFNYFGMYLV